MQLNFALLSSGYIILITHCWILKRARAIDSCGLPRAGYYYELDDSYDESDEEEVRAHLRRVAEQPPLKLDDSTEVMQCCVLQKALHTHCMGDN